MGFSSYECKHCNHSILSPASVDPEINSWMKDVVILGSGGSRLITEFDGYSGEYDEQVGEYGGNVWVHQACWEIAGKPEYDAYDGPSEPAGDQGFFFGREHDMIDPRITDEAERERLLKEGIEARDRRWYDGRARDVADWLDPKEREYHSEDEQREPWRLRFSYLRAYSEGEPVENGWWLRDKFNPEDGGLPIEDDEGELLVFKGTEDEVKAHLASHWARFIESDECRAYLARAEEMRTEARRKYMEELKAKGRYYVGYGPAPKGDTIKKEGERDWKGSRTIYRVEDRLTFKTVAVMDGPNKALGVKTFVVKPEERTKDGMASPEWGARVEELRAAQRESQRLAKAEAERLNKAWAAAGYPVPEDRL